MMFYLVFFVFFFNVTATTEIYTYGHTLSLHDALPIWNNRPETRPAPRRPAAVPRSTCSAAVVRRQHRVGLVAGRDLVGVVAGRRHLGVDQRNGRPKLRQVLAEQLLAGRQLDAQRVHLAAVQQHLVVEVRPGGAAGGADIGDDLALLDATAGAHALGEAGRVGVGGLDLAVVADADVVAVAAVALGHLHHAVASRHDRRPARGGEVHALVHLGVAENRVPALAEAGGQAGAVDRRAHQRLADAAAVGAEEVGDAAGRFEAVEGLRLPRQGHRGVVDLAVAHPLAEFVVVAVIEHFEAENGRAHV